MLCCYDIDTDMSDQPDRENLINRVICISIHNLELDYEFFSVILVYSRWILCCAGRKFRNIEML